MSENPTVSPGPQAMADRFTYFSGIGLLVMLAWSIPPAVWRMPVYVVGAVGMTLGLLIVFTFAQTRLSLKLIPGRGLVDSRDTTAIVFQRNH